MFEDISEIVLDHHLAEHERVARILYDGFDTADQMFVRLQVFLRLQPAHMMFDLIHEVGNPIRNRHINRIALLARHASLQQAGLAPAIGRELALGGGNEFTQQLYLAAIVFLAAEQDFDDFLEIQEPEGQAERVEIDDIRQIAEAAGVFVMRVHENDMRLGLLGEKFSQDDRDRAGFARAR